MSGRGFPENVIFVGLQHFLLTSPTTPGVEFLLPILNTVQHPNVAIRYNFNLQVPSSI